jgi:hypothetical protein
MTPTRKAFTKPAPTHDSSDPCVFCGARDGQAHGRACPEAAEWVEAERAWQQEHGE